MASSRSRTATARRSSTISCSPCSPPPSGIAMPSWGALRARLCGRHRGVGNPEIRMPAELVAPAAGTPTPGIVERVLALKALPELADQQPDDLATLARATTPLRLAPGAPLPADRSLHFLVDGSVRELRRGDPATRCDAPSAL